MIARIALAQSLLQHLLLAVMGPAFRSGVGAGQFARERPSRIGVLEQILREVSRQRFVHRQVLQHRPVPVSEQPGLFATDDPADADDVGYLGKTAMEAADSTGMRRPPCEKR